MCCQCTLCWVKVQIFTDKMIMCVEWETKGLNIVNKEKFNILRFLKLPYNTE